METTTEPEAPPLVLLSERLGAVTDAERELEAHGAVVKGAPLWTHDDIAAHAADARFVILGAVETVDAAAFDLMPRLLAIVRRGIGTDNVDVSAATARGILVANVPDASVEEVSDHALALLLALERNLVELDDAVRSGKWQRDPSEVERVRAPIRRMSTLTLGIVGLGRIGQALLRKGRGLYARVLAVDPVMTEPTARDLGAELVGLDELFADADHISLHAPLTPDTRQLVSATTLRLVRPGAIIVNTSRGGLIDEVALAEAVAEGRLRAAGLDVTDREPIAAGHPLLALPRLLVTAHSAASSQTTKVELVGRSVEAVRALLSGALPASVVNPEVLRTSNLRLAHLREADADVGT